MLTQDRQFSEKILESWRVFRYNVLIGCVPEGVYMKSEKRVLLLLAASAAVIILVTVLTLFSGKDTESAVNRPKPTATPKGAEPTAAIVAEYDKLLMVKSVDAEQGTITLYDLEDGGEVTLSYGVAADIRTKYGSLTYAASLKYGEIVRAEYSKEFSLVRMKESDEHWELHGVEEFTVTEAVLAANGTNYKLTTATVAYCDGTEIARGEVKNMDRINIWGLGSEILAMEVTKGHGSIKLINGEMFADAEVTFGDEKHTLNGEASYLVREGKYTVTVKGETNAAAVEIEVARNEQVVIDLYEYGGAPVETAQVWFKITPFSTVLKIDGEVTNYYEQELTLEYGEHTVVAELGGYTTYKGILKISKPYQTIQIDLSERPAGETGENDDTGNDDVGGSGTGDETENGDSTDSGNGETTGDGDSQNGDDNPDTGIEDNTDAKKPAEDVNYRFVPIGAAGGYTYDENHSTYLAVPEGAVVLIDGISLGTVPVKFEKILGSYTVTLRIDGGEKEFPVTVADDGKDVYWEFSME